MKKISMIALVSVAVSGMALAAGPFDQFKGKMKEGLYEYKMDMDMGQVPGMPAGMGKQSHTFQHCVSADDIGKGQMGKSGRDKMPENCEVKNFKMSGNTADYTMVCKGGPDMTTDNHITFKSDGYNMDMKMAMNENGHAMNMSQHMEAKYLGACKK